MKPLRTVSVRCELDYEYTGELCRVKLSRPAWYIILNGRINFVKNALSAIGQSIILAVPGPYTGVPH